MAEIYAEIERSDIERLRIYETYCTKSIDQVIQDTGYEYIMNGGFFRNAAPLQHLKVDGVVRSTDEWTYFGYLWNNALDLVMDRIPQRTAEFQNVLTCCTMIMNHTAQPLYYNADVAGYRRRTAIGTKGTKICLLVTTTGYTPESLRAYCLNTKNWDSGIMLDGGGSTQGKFLTNRIYSSDNPARKVENWICIKLKSASTGDNGGYPVPTRSLSLGSSGEDVKWVQFRLNQHGVVCDIDGSFGTGTDTAVKAFQVIKGLTADGSVGPATRTALAAAPTAWVNPFTVPTRTLIVGTSGDDVKWAQFQLVKAGFTCLIDGSFGSGTETKVKLFQTAHGLTADGSIGPLTRTALAAV